MTRQTTGETSNILTGIGEIASNPRGKRRALGADLLGALLDILGMGKCSKAWGHYDDLKKQCEDEIKDNCTGPDWLDHDVCAKSRGGVEKDGIRACILSKDPAAWNAWMDDCMSI